MWNNSKPLLLLLLIISTSIAGVGLTAFAAPAALTALGFTGTGIAANTAAAWLMKISAIANGGGVPAGGVVATLQSLGTSSFSYLTGGAAGHAFHKNFICGKKEASKGKK
ncbi:interferon alpha-inducible protein 27-like protein 2A isoform X2 [Ambystoma mexicanum]|uniref:interferon alpha-inducible protein 27-like protein 2A isoform X2 n=1 Tax=Ambystoma mexicanum TaxID=8296 RepID=UPI0037E77D30